MPSSYPTGLDSFATTRADSTVTATTHAADHNNANDALNKIEAELGINPSGADATVAVRLGVIQNGAPDYTTTNVTTTRSMDANSATQDTIADVLGTLINDLIAKGILG